MNRFVRWLLTAAAFTGMAAVAWAGGVGDYSQPHVVTVDLPKETHNSTFPNGKDSLSFFIETCPKPLGAAYDTASVTDTLKAIPLENDWGAINYFNNGTVVGSTDSVFVGRLTINFDRAYGVLGSADSVLVYTDVSPDGNNFVSQIALESDSKGGILRLGANAEGATMIIKDLWTNTSNKFAGIVSNQTICSCWHAKAIRFRVAMSTASVRKRVVRATFTYASSGPNQGR